MELIKGLTQTIKASFPAIASGFEAKVYNEAGDEIGTAVLVDNDNETPGVQVNPSAVEFIVPHSVVVEEGKYRLAISYDVSTNTYIRNIHFHVSTPYLEYWELREILSEEEGFTEAEVWEVESAARQMINVFCGQEFGYAHKTVKFRGEDGTALAIPERIISIDKLQEGPYVKYDINSPQGTSFLGKDQFVITGSGWYLKRPKWAAGQWEGEYYSSDPIVAPTRNNASYYRNDVEYVITGTFGYEEVPGPVKEAMKLLVNDYACGEQLYRDRFLESMKAADWRLQFNPGAYYKTGNARANLLLSPYVVNRMKVI